MPENQGGQAVYKMTPEKMGDALGDFLNQYKKFESLVVVVEQTLNTSKP